MKITKRQLRRIIREAIDYPEGYEPTNVDRVYEIIQPLFDEWNIGFDRQGEIAMEIASMYTSADWLDMSDRGSSFLKDEIYARAEEQIKADQEELEVGEDLMTGVEERLKDWGYQ